MVTWTLFRSATHTAATAAATTPATSAFTTLAALRGAIIRTFALATGLLRTAFAA